jgi:hypothetical protein
MQTAGKSRMEGSVARARKVERAPTPNIVAAGQCRVLNRRSTMWIRLAHSSRRAELRGSHSGQALERSGEMGLIAESGAVRDVAQS